jgi:hypothetical protein
MNDARTLVRGMSVVDEGARFEASRTPGVVVSMSRC